MNFLNKYFLLFTGLPLVFFSCSMTYEHSMEVNMPLEQTWNTLTNPHNWPLWSEQTEFVYCAEDIRPGTIIHLKLRDSNLCIPILVTEVVPYEQFNFITDICLISEKNFNSFEEITPQKSRIITRIDLRSCFVPFFKSSIRRSLDIQHAKIKLFLDEIGQLT